MFEDGPTDDREPAAGSASPPSHTTAPGTAGEAFLAELNDRQREAATHQGPSVLVIAGAGSGKTKTLAGRVAHLVRAGVPAERILLLTFTRRAAQEMLGRAERMCSATGAGRVWGGTFHSVANRLLRMHGNALGLQPSFTVMDQADGADMMNLIRCEQGLAARDRRFPKKETLAAIYSRTVNARTRLTEVVDERFPWCREEVDGIASIFKAYTERKRDQAVLDYDDLLLYWDALVSAPGLRKTVSGLFDHILVDEYQDTNALQADIVLKMRGDETSVMVVGDDAQAIYSFRAATVDNILEFPQQHRDTHVVKLERNYRSTDSILRATNGVIAQARRRYTKDLWSTTNSPRKPELVTCADESQQSELVCRQVLEQRERGVALKSQAVLFRAGHHSGPLEVELTRRNIPFVKFGGLKFVEAAHVKDVIAFLRLVENPYDELSWFRVLQLLEGIGPSAATRITAELGVRRAGRGGAPAAHDAGVSTTEEGHARSPLARLEQQTPAVPAGAAADFSRFRGAVAACAGSPEMPVDAQLQRVRDLYEPIVQRIYDAPASRLNDIEQLAHIAGGCPSRSRFLADLTLDPPNSTGDLAGPPLLDEDYLILSTIHSAKGCEWDVVQIIHAADGMIPSDMAVGDEEGLEEELRLLYVAMTRARRSLHVYFPLRYYHRRTGVDDAHSYAQLTRFIPRSLHDLFEHRTPAPPPDREIAAATDKPAPAATRAVEDFLSALWD